MMSNRESLFHDLYDQQYQAIYAYFLGRTNHREAASDLLQETFLQVWKHIDTLEALTEARRRYWLFTVAKNKLTDYYRKRKNEQLPVGSFNESNYPISSTVEDDPATQLVGKERNAAIDTAIKELPEDLRTVLLMQVAGDMSSADISEVLDLPAGTVRYKIHQARKRMAHKIGLLEKQQGGSMR